MYNELRTYALARLLEHGLWQDGWRFQWDNAKRRAGATKYKKKVITLSRPVCKLRTIEDAKETIRHEIAHALAGYEAHHNGKWKRIAVSVGAKPEACFTFTAEQEAKVKYSWYTVCRACGFKNGWHRRPRVLTRSCPKCSGGRYNEKFKMDIVRA